MVVQFGVCLALSYLAAYPNISTEQQVNKFVSQRIGSDAGTICSFPIIGVVLHSPPMMNGMKNQLSFRYACHRCPAMVIPNNIAYTIAAPVEGS